MQRRGSTGSGKNAHRGASPQDRPQSSERPRSAQRVPRGDRGERQVDEFLESVDVKALPRSVWRDLGTLSDQLREPLERLLAASRLTIEDEPERALAYAKAAREKAPRLAVVREAYGVAAYRNGDFKLARTELQAARRMAGRDDLLPLLADCERALGKPEQALKLAVEATDAKLAGADAIEMLLVVSGARRDMGQPDIASVLLERPANLANRAQPWAARLIYAYADSLAELGRTDEAIQWFRKAADWDTDYVTDASERIDDLGGVAFIEPQSHDPHPDGLN